MLQFQLDENNDCDKFAKSCNANGLASVSRFKKKFKNTGMKDPEVLEWNSPRGRVLLTFDDKMIEKHKANIPEQNPGIVTVGHSPHVMKTMTQKSGNQIVEKFKQAMPNWHQTPLANSIVRIKDDSVIVCRKIEGRIDYLLEAHFEQEDFVQVMQACLISNAAIGLLPGVMTE